MRFLVFYSCGFEQTSEEWRLELRKTMDDRSSFAPSLSSLLFAHTTERIRSSQPSRYWSIRLAEENRLSPAGSTHPSATPFDSFSAWSGASRLIRSYLSYVDTKTTVDHTIKTSQDVVSYTFQRARAGPEGEYRSYQGRDGRSVIGDTKFKRTDLSASIEAQTAI